MTMYSFMAGWLDGEEFPIPIPNQLVADIFKMNEQVSFPSFIFSTTVSLELFMNSSAKIC